MFSRFQPFQPGTLSSLLRAQTLTGVELVGGDKAGEKHEIKKTRVFLYASYIFTRLVSSDRFFGRQVPNPNSSTPVSY